MSEFIHACPYCKGEIRCEEKTQLVKCPHCGNNSMAEKEYKCECKHCGKALVGHYVFKKTRCPHCGKTTTASWGFATVACMHCNRSFVNDEAGHWVIPCVHCGKTTPIKPDETPSEWRLNALSRKIKPDDTPVKTEANNGGLWGKIKEIDLGCWLWIIIIIGIIVGLGTCMHNLDDTPGTVVYEYSFEKSMKKNLFDPDSAEFIWQDSVIDADGRFWGKCRIRAKNAFGAYIYKDYIVTGSETSNKIEWQEL